jgi:hypothetical protein
MINKDVSAEELLRLLEEEEGPKPKKRKPKDRKEVMKFIRDMGIEPGHTKVSTDLIYYNFVKWTENTWAKKRSKIDFFRTFSRHFEQHRKTKQRYYLINDVLDTSEEMERKAIRYNEREYEKKKQKREE